MNDLKLRGQDLLIALSTSLLLMLTYIVLQFCFDLNPIIVFLVSSIIILKELFYHLRAKYYKCYQKELYMYDGYKFIIFSSIMFYLISLPLLWIPEIFLTDKRHVIIDILTIYFFIFMSYLLASLFKTNPKNVKSVINESFDTHFTKNYKIELNGLDAFYNFDFQRQLKFCVLFNQVFLEYDIKKGICLILNDKKYTKEQIDVYLLSTGLNFVDVFNNNDETEIFEMYSI